MDIKAPAVGAQAVPRAERMSRVRFVILAMLFIVTTINYADRATISIAGSAMQKNSASMPCRLAIFFRRLAGLM